MILIKGQKTLSTAVNLFQLISLTTVLITLVSVYAFVSYLVPKKDKDKLPL